MDTAFLKLNLCCEKIQKCQSANSLCVNERNIHLLWGRFTCKLKKEIKISVLLESVEVNTTELHCQIVTSLSLYQVRNVLTE
jgi:hypothetical protein